MADLLNDALAAVGAAHSDSPNSTSALTQAVLLVGIEIRESRRVQEKFLEELKTLRDTSAAISTPKPKRKEEPRGA
jgi:hypothetical protein